MTKANLHKDVFDSKVLNPLRCWIIANVCELRMGTGACCILTPSTWPWGINKL